MGRQIQLYLVPEDVKSLEAVLRQRHVQLVAWSSPDASPSILNTSVTRNEHGFRSHCYLVRPHDVENLQLEHVPERGYWTISPYCPQVIEFNGGFFDGKMLRRGRLFYQTEYLDANGLWVKNPEDFTKWAESISRLVKKRFKRDPVFDAYLGDSAREWLATTAGKLDI